MTRLDGVGAGFAGPLTPGPLHHKLSQVIVDCQFTDLRQDRRAPGFGSLDPAAWNL